MYKVWDIPDEHDYVVVLAFARYSIAIATSKINWCLLTFAKNCYCMNILESYVSQKVVIITPSKAFIIRA